MTCQHHFGDPAKRIPPHICRYCGASNCQHERVSEDPPDGLHCHRCGASVSRHCRITKITIKATGVIYVLDEVFAPPGWIEIRPALQSQKVTVTRRPIIGPARMGF